MFMTLLSVVVYLQKKKQMVIYLYNEIQYRNENERNTAPCDKMDDDTQKYTW